eukprot:CAMPEP_0198697950 /NCGR_PEP_ID=MMETSP1468-20131203/330093_1 /TAXON_ID=1461545 /ORGANISM="Mantoniella sp, Strain CCMP1436" /LENGTH=1125 /DNA_ID=CAMNT_0044454783 /DNA_START=114 /DNA_END=3491 /DNA_ORIENTATION=+
MAVSQAVSPALMREEMGLETDDDAINALMCPITGVFFVDPVMAADDRVYSRGAIEGWFASQESMDREMTSPLTRAVIETELTPCLDIRNAVEEHLTRLEELRQSRADAIAQEEVDEASDRPVDAGDTQPGLERTSSLDPSREREPTSIQYLNKMFEKLDSVRDILKSSLSEENWQPPQLVVIGQESSGKSSLLERLVMMPIFPRNKKFCTKVPIHVRLRYSEEALPPTLEVYDVAQGQTLIGPYPVPAANAEFDVRAEMQNIMDDVYGELDDNVGVSGEKIIIVRINRPDVPTLDLIDMPGLVSTGPRQVASRKIITDHIDRHQGDDSLLYLFVVPAGERPSGDLASQIIEEYGLQDKTIGVYTKCDKLTDEDDVDDFMEKLKAGRRGSDEDAASDNGTVLLEEYGWVATSTKEIRDETLGAFTRLRRQARSEFEFFMDGQQARMGLRDLTLIDGAATVPMLIKQLNDMFKNYLHKTWVPKTLEKLELAAKITLCEYLTMGASVDSFFAGGNMGHDSGRPHTAFIRHLTCEIGRTLQLSTHDMHKKFRQQTSVAVGAMFKMCTLEDDAYMDEEEVEVNETASEEKKFPKFNFVNTNETSRAVIISSASAIELGWDDTLETEQTLGSLLTDIDAATETLLSSVSGATNRSVDPTVPDMTHSAPQRSRDSASFRAILVLQSGSIVPMLKRSESFMVKSDEFHTFWFSTMRQKFQSNFDDQFSKEMLIDFFNKEIVRAVAYTTPSWIKSSMTLVSDADVTGEAKVHGLCPAQGDRVVVVKAPIPTVRRVFGDRASYPIGARLVVTSPIDGDMDVMASTQQSPNEGSTYVNASRLSVLRSSEYVAREILPQVLEDPPITVISHFPGVVKAISSYAKELSENAFTALRSKFDTIMERLFDQFAPLQNSLLTFRAYEAADGESYVIGQNPEGLASEMLRVALLKIQHDLLKSLTDNGALAQIIDNNDDWTDLMEHNREAVVKRHDDLVKARNEILNANESQTTQTARKEVAMHLHNMEMRNVSELIVSRSTSFAYVDETWDKAVSQVAVHNQSAKTAPRPGDYIRFKLSVVFPAFNNEGWNGNMKKRYEVGIAKAYSFGNLHADFPSGQNFLIRGGEVQVVQLVGDCFSEQ